MEGFVTYDDWKTRDVADEQAAAMEWDTCPACHRSCDGSKRCGCCPTCDEIANYEEPNGQTWAPCTVCQKTEVCASEGFDTCADCQRRA